MHIQSDFINDALCFGDVVHSCSTMVQEYNVLYFTKYTYKHTVLVYRGVRLSLEQHV